MGDRGFRTEVLSEVSRALGGEHRQPESIPLETNSEESKHQFDCFVQEFEKVGGRLFETNLSLKVVEYVADVVDSLKLREVALSDSKILEEISLTQRLREHLGETGKVVRADRSLEKSDLIRLLGKVEVGITSCRFAIAETGTIVLKADCETNRLLSLLPPIHIVILRPDQLVDTLGDVLEGMGTENLDRAVTLITGPSRTADIELTLTKGVHGPREVHAIFYDGE